MTKLFTKFVNIFELRPVYEAVGSQGILLRNLLSFCFVVC